MAALGEGEVEDGGPGVDGDGVGVVQDCGEGEGAGLVA